MSVRNFQGKWNNRQLVVIAGTPAAKILPFSLFVQFSDGSGCVGDGEEQEEESVALAERAEDLLGSCATMAQPNRARQRPGKASQGRSWLLLWAPGNYRKSMTRLERRG